MRPIDSDALIEAHYQHCNEHPNDAFETWSLMLMQNAPSIDAVEVVRCKDCVYSDERPNNPIAELYCTRFKYMKYKLRIEVDEDGYCSFGERRADETD